MLNVIMLSVTFTYCYGECYYAWFRIFLVLYWFLLCWMSLCWVSLCSMSLFWISLFTYCFSECHYAEFHIFFLLCWLSYVECHYTEYCFAECHYAECHIYLLLWWVLLCSVSNFLIVLLIVVMLNVIMLSVVMLNVSMLSVVMLNVIMLSVVASLSSVPSNVWSGCCFLSVLILLTNQWLTSMWQQQGVNAVNNLQL